MTLDAVSDTGPLIHLGEIDALSLLALPNRLFVPEIVHREFRRGDDSDGLDELEFTIVSPSADPAPHDDLDGGEAAALAIAKERNAVLLTDDLAARHRASDAGVEVHGSIGMIVLGYSRGRLEKDEAVTLIRSLQHETSLFVSDAVVDRAIELLEDG